MIEKPFNHSSYLLYFILYILICLNLYPLRMCVFDWTTFHLGIFYVYIYMLVGIKDRTQDVHLLDFNGSQVVSHNRE